MGYRIVKAMTLKLYLPIKNFGMANIFGILYKLLLVSVMQD